MAMNILELEEGLGSQAWGSCNRVHSSIEAMRLAFADVLAYDADPEVQTLVADSGCSAQN